MSTTTAPIEGQSEIIDGKPSCVDIILLYLKSKISIRKDKLGSQYAEHPYVDVWSTDLQLQVRAFSIKRFSKLHSPSTWGRRWREARQKNRLSAIGIEAVEVLDTDRDQRGWRLWTDREAYRKAQGLPA